MRTKVVIESPFKGKNPSDQDRNRRYAISCMIDSISRNESPYASHLLYTQVFTNEEDAEDRNLGIEMGFQWGEAAEMVAVYVDLGVTAGMREGIDRATLGGKIIEYRNLPETDILPPYEPTLGELVSAVARYFGRTYIEIRSQKRKREIADVRHVYCAVAKSVYPKFSLATIAGELGRDHCTALNSIKIVRNVVQVRDMYFEFCSKNKIKPLIYEQTKEFSTPLDS